MKDSYVQYNILRSEGKTNQRLYFDVATYKERAILASGTLEGSVILYDLTGGQCLGVFPALFDAIGAVALRVEGDQLLMATGSGQRHFIEDFSADSSSSDDEQSPVRTEYCAYRNGLRLWSLNV